jgi:hypothetical protein
VQSSFSKNTKVSEELDASVPMLEVRFILIIEAAPYSESLATISNISRRHNSEIHTLNNNGLQLYCHNLWYYSGIFLKELEKTSENHNRAVSVPAEIRMRYCEDKNDKRYGLRETAPYDFLLNQSKVTVV